MIELKYIPVQFAGIAQRYVSMALGFYTFSLHLMEIIVYQSVSSSHINVELHYLKCYLI